MANGLFRDYPVRLFVKLYEKPCWRLGLRLHETPLSGDASRHAIGAPYDSRPWTIGLL